MKRFTLLSLLVLLCVAVGRAQTLSQLAPDEITAGKRIVLRGAAVNNIYYFNGGEANEAFADGMKVFVVEEAATEGKVVLRGEVSGEYVAKPSGAANANALVDATADKSGAAEFTVSAANYTTGADLTTDYTFEQVKLVRFVTSGTDGADTYLNTNSQGSKAKYFDGKGNWSVWAVYELPAGENLPFYVDVDAPVVSEDGNIHYYFIRSYRSGKYLTYAGDEANLTQGTERGDGAMWYFTADGTAEGGLKVKIHNAATENLLAGHSSFTAEGATWYVKPNPHNSNGSCISLNEALDANCLDANNQDSGVGYWQPSANDNEGTTWQFAREVSAEEYIANLCAERCAEVKAVLLRAKGCVGAPNDADIEKVLAQMETLTTDPSLEGLFALNVAVAALQPGAENNVVPDGLYRIQNYQRKISTGNNPCNGEGGYIEAIDQLKPAHSECLSRAFSAVDQNEASADALWQLQATSTDGVYRLYNPNSGLYMKQTDGDSNQEVTSTPNADEAATFSFGTYEGVPGQSSIMCAERESVNNRYLHCSGNLNDGQDASARIMFYTAGANGPSAWYIRPVETLDVTLTQVGDMAWASTVLPVNVDELPEGVTAYTGKLDETAGVLRLTEVEGGKVPAGLPVVLAAEAAGLKQLPVSAAQAPVSVDESGALQGTLRYVSVADDTRDSYLILGIYDDAVGFYLPAEATTAIPGNKAYLDNSTAQAVRGYALSLGGATTGIEGVTTAGGTGSEEPVYDLSGRRVVNPTHGVYIRGGKKVYIK